MLKENRECVNQVTAVLSIVICKRTDHPTIHPVCLLEIARQPERFIQCVGVVDNHPSFCRMGQGQTSLSKRLWYSEARAKHSAYP
ncbi:hypothetical protein D3C76_1727310 [compost metagenome]